MGRALARTAERQLRVTRVDYVALPPRLRYLQ
jgi:hypothetical protein